MAEAQRSIEALTAAAGADKDSAIAALQARTRFCIGRLRQNFCCTKPALATACRNGCTLGRLRTVRVHGCRAHDDALARAKISAPAPA